MLTRFEFRLTPTKSCLALFRQRSWRLGRRETRWRGRETPLMSVTFLLLPPKTRSRPRGRRRFSFVSISLARGHLLNHLILILGSWRSWVVLVPPFYRQTEWRSLPRRKFGPLMKLVTRETVNRRGYGRLGTFFWCRRP